MQVNLHSIETHLWDHSEFLRCPWRHCWWYQVDGNGPVRVRVWQMIRAGAARRNKGLFCLPSTHHDTYEGKINPTGGPGNLLVSLKIKEDKLSTLYSQSQYRHWARDS